MLGLSFIEDGGELQLVSGHKCFLERWVEVVIEQHKLQPPIAQERSEDLANAWCEGNRPEVGSIISSWSLCNQLLFSTDGGEQNGPSKD